MRFEFIAKHRGIWPVSWICEALDVSRSGFHAGWFGPLRSHSNDVMHRRNLGLLRPVPVPVATRSSAPGSAPASSPAIGRTMRAGLARPSGRRPLMWLASHRAADACSRPEGASAAPRAAEGRWPAVGHRRQPPRSPVHGRGAQPEVDRGLHPRLRGGRLYIWTAEGGTGFPTMRSIVGKPVEGGCTSPSSSTCSRAGWSAGR